MNTKGHKFRLVVPMTITLCSI